MKATAYIVGPQPPLETGLKKLLTAAGMTDIQPFDGLKSVEEGMDAVPISFISFEHSNDAEAVRKAVRQLRGCKRRNVRFLPLIYFCHNPSRDLIQECLMLGFDDVISLPSTPKAIAARLRHQLSRQITYFETSQYFGPDRRSLQRGLQEDSLGRNGEQALNRFEFVRTLENGISITARQAIAA